MLITAAVLFALGALGGLTLATLHFRGRALPMPLALLHGLLGALGLVVLALGVFQKGEHALVPFILFVIAALGGFVLFSFHLRSRPHPSPAVVIHGLVAVIAFVLLLIAIAGAPV